MPITRQSMKFAAVALAVAVLGAAAPGAVTPAEAKKGVHVHLHHGHGIHFGHRRHFYYGPAYRFAGGYGDCHWLKVKAYRTGSGYWWSRYRACTGYY